MKIFSTSSSPWMTKTRLGFGSKEFTHFVGYQAVSTLGRSLLEGATNVKLFGESIEVQAEICQLTGLIAHEEDGELLPPEVVLEVVADTARLAHAAGRKDDLGHRVGVDHPGFVTGNADPQPRELDGIDALGQQRPGILVKAVGVGIFEDAGRLNGKGAVDVDREIAVAGDQTLFFDLTVPARTMWGS